MTRQEAWVRFAAAVLPVFEYRKSEDAWARVGKAADAMLVVGTAEVNLGDTAAAKKTFEDLITRHPNSDAAEKARARLARLRQAASSQ